MTLTTEETKKYWNKRLTSDVPEQVQNAIKRIYSSYLESHMPQGLSDPMYIMNVICKELGVGDGESNFFLNDAEFTVFDEMSRESFKTKDFKIATRCAQSMQAVIIYDGKVIKDFSC